MEHPETVLGAIFEDRLSESEFEEGEIEEDGEIAQEFHPMDVDACHGPTEEEEGEVEDEVPSGARYKSDNHGSVKLGNSNDYHANGDVTQAGDVNQPHPRKKRKKKRSGKRPRTVNLSQFVRETCSRLREKKYQLVWAAVNKLGVDAIKDLVKEVDVIEKCGGQMTNDGKRRRTPGGVMWNILRGRVQPDVYKEIMSQGKEEQKQKIKEAKESLKRNRMDVDEPVNNKRQKLADDEVDISAAKAHGTPVSKPHKRLRPARLLLDVTDGPRRDDSLLPIIQMQKAWAEGLRKKDNFGEEDALPVNTSVVDSGLTKGELACDAIRDKKSTPVLERIRAPVEYGDLVTENKSSPAPEKPRMSNEYSDLVEGSLLEDIGQCRPQES